MRKILLVFIALACVFAIVSRFEKKDVSSHRGYACDEEETEPQYVAKKHYRRW